jgi:glycosyltransferase involved in cell wall biosynthesis
MMKSEVQSVSSRLAILGSWPPPAGGVSIHTQRLSRLLEDRGIPHVVYNATSDAGDGFKVVSVFKNRRSWLIKYLFGAREKAIYLFSGRLSAWCIGALMATIRQKRVVLRLRNSDLIDWLAHAPMKRWLCKRALPRMSAVVCVNHELREAAIRIGVAPERVHWSPGFLPPDDESMRKDSVAAEVWEFVERHGPIVAANGKIGRYEGEDLYGLDHLVELAYRLKSDYPNLGVVVCFWEHLSGERTELEALRQRAKALGVAENILFHTQPGPFVPVLRAADVFVRPTNTDGDANSIREALFLGVPTIASDVVIRPPGTRLFPTRDLDAMGDKVREALADNTHPRDAPTGLTEQDHTRIAHYLDLLSALTEGRPLPSALPTPQLSGGT